MKNFPHQFNDLTKLFNALLSIKELIEEERPLSDDNFGELLTRKGIYTYRNRDLTIDQFLLAEERKPKSNRGFLTVARDIRRLFQLLDFIIIFDDKSGKINTKAIQLLTAPNDETKKELWRKSFLQLGLIDSDGNISNPYKILLKLVREKPGIETSKLMLALEAKDNSDEEFNRIVKLSEMSFDDIIETTRTSVSMARNAVKILPGIAEQLSDIKRKNNNTFPIATVSITEDDITTDIPENATNSEGIPYFQTRNVDSNTIARDPIFNASSSVTIDLEESIKIRQQRLSEHQIIVRKLGKYCENLDFQLFEGRFDCLCIKDSIAHIFEIKTILDKITDQEKQTIKGVGQLKYYNYSIVYKQMGFANAKEFLVYSQKPSDPLIEFCNYISISVVWPEEEIFKVFDSNSNSVVNFNPLDFS